MIKNFLFISIVAISLVGCATTNDHTVSVERYHEEGLITAEELHEFDTTPVERYKNYNS